MSSLHPEFAGASTLIEAMQDFRSAMTGNGISLPDAELLAEYYKDLSTGDRWEDILDNDIAAVSVLFNHAHEKHRAYPYKLVTRSVPASVAFAFSELMHGLHGAEGLQQIIGGYFPVPLFQIGPVFVVGHFNPGVPRHDLFPSDLFIHVWLTVAEYRAMRTDYITQAQAYLAHRSAEHFQAGATSRSIVAPVSFQHFVAEQESGMDEGSEESRLRAFASWIKCFPSITTGDEQVLSALAAKEESLTEDSFPADLRLLARHFLRHDRVIKTDFLEINRKIASDLDGRITENHQLCPIALTDKYVFLLTDGPISHKLGDDFANHTSLTPVAIIVASHQFQAACSETAQVSLLSLADAGAAGAESEPPAFELRPNAFTADLPEGALKEPELLLQFICFSAVNARAADIHIEWTAGVYRVRFTIDGVGQEAMRLPGDTHDGLASRIKSHARIDLDAIGSSAGRFCFAIGTRQIETRVQLIFDMHRKARFSMRLRDTTQPIKDVASLGLSELEISILADTFKSPDGIMFVCGPTGAGKSTTLCAVLNEINRPERIIFSLEDPPEYAMPGVTQIMCTADPERERANLPTFARMVKDLLRMGPHAIAIGEVRDLPTASVAVEASLTGHFVATSLHTDSTFNGIQRLVDLKVEPTTFASTAKLFVCQRLIRRVCRCAKLEPITPQQREFFESAGVEVPAYRKRIPVATGCQQCRGTGYKDRLVVMELLRITPEIKKLIMQMADKRADLRDIQAEAERLGFRSLYQNALTKVLHGYTTVAEVDRVIRRVERSRRGALGAALVPMAKIAA